MAMSLEEMGVPTIAVHTNVFARVARATASANGMPRTRQAFVPQPLVGQTVEQLRGYIEGPDPITKRPFMVEVIEGLTKPLDADDLKGAGLDRSIPRLLPPDSEENLHELFLRNHWTDCLPVVLPTEERVEKMLKGTKVARDKMVGKLRPTAFREFWEFDVEKIAVNAVMAGARPEYLPVILAMSASGVTARSSSTTSFATLSVVNGPIREEIGMNDGIGALGPYNHANSTIGRAYSLLCQNLQGGSVPGETYMGSLGNFLAYTACFPEAEERSPWAPFHVDHGFSKNDSAVSVFFGGWYTQSGYGPRDNWQSKFIRCLTALEHYQQPLIVMDPIVARGFEDLGYTKQKLIDWCAANAKLTARDYWDDQWAQTLVHPLAVAGVEPYASRLKTNPDELVNLFLPEDIKIVVTGGETQGAFKMFGGRYAGRGPGTFNKENPTVIIDAWR
jgi:hypothetical protein